MSASVATSARLREELAVLILMVSNTLAAVTVTVTLVTGTLASAATRAAITESVLVLKSLMVPFAVAVKLTECAWSV